MLLQRVPRIKMALKWLSLLNHLTNKAMPDISYHLLTVGGVGRCFFFVIMFI
jgi:hypothetical protein